MNCVINKCTLIPGWVNMNSPRDGSSVNPLTPDPVLNTNCKIITFQNKQSYVSANPICEHREKEFEMTLSFLDKTFKSAEKLKTQMFSFMKQTVKFIYTSRERLLFIYRARASIHAIACCQHILSWLQDII